MVFTVALSRPNVTWGRWADLVGFMGGPGYISWASREYFNAHQFLFHYPHFPMYISLFPPHVYVFYTPYFSHPMLTLTLFIAKKTNLLIINPP
jgi:hypothetical protein